MDRFGRRVGVDRAEEDEPSIQVVAGRDFDRLTGGQAVADQHDVILKRANLDCAPGDALDDSSQFVGRHDDYVAYLERTICMQGNAREEISQRVLQRQTDDDAENRRGGDEAAQVYFLIDTIENQDEENRKSEQREDIPNQRGPF